MKYAWNREPKHTIRPANRPKEHRGLSGVVLVYKQGVGKAYVKFDDKDVELLGKKMPYGLGPENPGYLKVVGKHGHYDVLCSYIDKSKTILLWKTDKIPEWVRRVRYAEAC